jgi:hypothetical protein
MPSENENAPTKANPPQLQAIRKAIYLALRNRRHCDVRYAVFYGRILDYQVVLDHVVLSRGADFFKFFQRCKGKGVNTKRQIRLPGGFFS